jgi:hypothetical protein
VELAVVAVYEDEDVVMGEARAVAGAVLDIKAQFP